MVIYTKTILVFCIYYATATFMIKYAIFMLVSAIFITYCLAIINS